MGEWGGDEGAQGSREGVIGSCISVWMAQRLQRCTWSACGGAEGARETHSEELVLGGASASVCRV